MAKNEAPTETQMRVLRIVDASDEQLTYREIGERLGIGPRGVPMTAAGAWSHCMYLAGLGLLATNPPRITAKGRVVARRK